MQSRNYPVLLTTSVEKKWLCFTVILKRISVTVPCGFLGWVFFFLYWSCFITIYRAIIIRNGEVIPMSSEFTPETERQRLQYLVRDRTTKSGAADDKHCPVISKVQTHDAELLWLSGGPRIRWTPVTDHVCRLAISKCGEKPGGANPDERSLLFCEGHRLVWRCLCTLFSCRPSAAHWCWIMRAQT